MLVLLCSLLSNAKHTLIWKCFKVIIISEICFGKFHNEKCWRWQMLRGKKRKCVIRLEKREMVHCFSRWNVQQEWKKTSHNISTLVFFAFFFFVFGVTIVSGQTVNGHLHLHKPLFGSTFGSAFSLCKSLATQTQMNSLFNWFNFRYFQRGLLPWLGKWKHMLEIFE